jgi:hypothetical protein
VPVIDDQGLYQLQNAVLADLRRVENTQFAAAKLCGGTALSRCWLGHRLSYDLDFFLPYGFKAREMAESLKKAGVAFEVHDMVDDARIANQLHGYMSVGGEWLKVSFMEDAYFELFPAVDREIDAGLSVRTEEIPGLYHRKLRTVAGNAEEGHEVVGGRQKARDLFDLYVLAESFQPIRPFIQSLPYTFPSEAFDNGLVSMPWFDLVDELGEINCAPNWVRATDVAFLQQALFEQIGAVLPGRGPGASLDPEGEAE